MLREIQKLDELKRAFRNIALSIDDVFPDNARLKAYFPTRKWIIAIDEDFIVINSLPLGEINDDSYWEEWYRITGEEQTNHHLLTIAEPEKYTEMYNPPNEYDGIHPEEIFGFSWFVRDLLYMESENY